MDEFDYRDWERREEAADWNDITSGTDEQRAGALMNRALNIGIWDNSQLERVIGYLGAAVEINRRIKRSPELFTSLKMLAEAYSRQQRWDDCIEALDEAILVAGNELQDDRMRASALGWRAWVCSCKRDFRGAALGYANTAQLSAVCRPECAARDMNFSARTWVQISEYQLAIVAAEQSLELARENDCLDDAVDSHYLLAYCFARIENKERARKHFDLAKSQSEVAGPGPLTGNLILRTEGFINLLESNFEQADKCFSEAVENHRKAKYFDAVADATFGRALVAFQQGDSDQALGFLKSILDSVEQIRLNADFVAVGELFEEIYDESNNYLDALDTWRRIRVAMRNSDPTSENLRRCDARIVILEAKLAEQPARKAEILTELRVELGDDFFGHFDAVSELGRAFIGCQKAEMAMRLADEALALPAYREGFPEFDCEWLDIKARAQELLGDYLGAKTSADRAFELYFDREAYFLAKEMRDLSLRVAKLAA